MTLSVVIPSYNSSQLDRVITSLLPLKPKEIIVVDSSPVAPSLPKFEVIRLIHLKKRVYPGEARNKGWRESSGEFVLFVDADVEFTDTSRQFVKNKLASAHDGMAFGVYAEKVDGDNAITRVIVAIQRHRFCGQEQSREVSYGQSSHLLIKRDLYKKTGFFNPWYRMHEDKEICARAGFLNINKTTFPEFEVNHLKFFTLKTLFIDHSDKAYLAVKNVFQDKQLFSKTKTLIEPKYKITWILSFLVVVVFPFILIVQPKLAAISLLLLLLPALICKEAFSRLGLTDKLAGLALWPYIGFATVAGSCAGVLVGLKIKAIRIARWLKTMLVSFYRVLIKNGMPVNLVHFMTSRCNLRCAHCFYKESLDAKDPGEQPLALIEKITSSAGPVLWYAIGGGEPFVRSDIVDIHKVILQNSSPIMFSIPTNGWYVEKTFIRVLEMLQQAEGRHLTIQISLDGPETLHDEIRGKGSWSRAVETYEKLKQLQRMYPNLTIGVITVVNMDNHQCFPDFIDELVDRFKPQQIAINMVRDEVFDQKKLSPEVISAYKKSVERYEGLISSNKIPQLGYFGRRVMRAKEMLQKQLIYAVAKNNEFVTPCQSGSLSYVIWEDGSLAPCEVLPDRLGNLNDAASFKDIVRSPKAKALRKRIVENECRCTYECAMTINTFFSWPMTKKLAKQLLKNDY